MTNIFEYSNISDPNIYSDIRSYKNFDTNIFVYSFISKNFKQIYSDIRSCYFLDTNIFEYSFVSKSIQMSHSGVYVVFGIKLPTKKVFFQPPSYYFFLSFLLKSDNLFCIWELVFRTVCRELSYPPKKM